MQLLPLALLLGSASAIRVPARLPTSRRTVIPASLPAVLVPLSASATIVDDVMYELNRPPITMNPFTVTPVGYTFFIGYAAYLAWTIFKPPSEAEEKAAVSYAD